MATPRRWVMPASAPLPGMPALLGQILASRGFDEAAARELLNAPNIVHDSYQLDDMHNAVETVRRAIAEGRRIAVYGDFDCDGITACAALVRTLREAGADVVPYIPNRMAEGYGLHAAALQELGRQGIGCVVSVDCGTSSADVAAGRPAGMLLAITDHHLPLRVEGEEHLAHADAHVNPKKEADSYPFEGLAGAGVAYKLVQALEREGIARPGAADRIVWMSMLGTRGDMMPVLDENRTIISRGLRALAELQPPGIVALAAEMGVRLPLAEEDLDFKIIPAINATGRMEDARLALDLLLCDDPAEAARLAQQVRERNEQRKLTLAQALVQAEREAAALDPSLPAIVLGSRDWHMGIVGLVANRIAERYGKPCFIVSLDGPEAKGSARSGSPAHIVHILERASATVLRYGGHQAAAGFSVDPARFEAFRAAILDSARIEMDSIPRERELRVDAVIRPSEISRDLIRQVDRLRPFGQGFREPVFAMRNLQVWEWKQLGSNPDNIRLTLRGASGGFVKVAAWGVPDLVAQLRAGGPQPRLDVCCTIGMRTWRGRDGMDHQSIEVTLRDWRPGKLLQQRELVA